MTSRSRGSARIRQALLLVAALSLVLAACSSDGSDGAADGGTAGSDATSTSSPGPTATTAASAPDTPFDPATATREAYVDALDDALGDGSADDGQIVVTGEQAVCIAPLWIDAITVDALVADEVSPDLLADPGYRFGPLGLSEEQADAMLDAYATCGADVYGLFALALTPDQDVPIQTCAVGKMDHELARTALVSALTGATSLEDDLNRLVSQVVDACQPTG